MNYTIDYLMFMNDGINPLFTHMMGKGGLGYKPEGNMIGGMPVRNVKGKIKSQYFDNKSGDFDYDKMKDYNPEEIPQLIESDYYLKNKPKLKINRLFNDIADLSKIYNDDIDNDDNEKNVNDILSKINILSDSIGEYFNRDTTEKSLREYGYLVVILHTIKQQIVNKELITKIKTINEETKEEILFSPIIKKMIIKFNKNIQSDKSDFYYGTYNQALEKDPDNIATVRGNIAEDILTKNSLIMNVFDRDNSIFKNTKDISAYSNEYQKWLTDNLETTQKIDNLLQYMPFDGIKKKTIWEIKSFSTDAYGNPITAYNQTKFNVSIFKHGGKKYTFTFLYNVENPDIINGKKKPVTMFDYESNTNGSLGKLINLNNISAEIEEKGKPPIIIKNILKIRNKGYNYYLLESTPNGYRGINPLDDFSNRLKEGNPQIKSSYRIRSEYRRTFPPSYELQNEHSDVENFIREREKI